MTEMNQNSAKPDNLLGICHAIGTAFGFNPLILRVGFVLAMLASPQYAMLTYAVLGVAVGVAALVNRLGRSRRTPGQPATLPEADEYEAEPERLAA